MSSPQRGVSARSTLTAGPECMLRRTTYGSRGRSFSCGCCLRPPEVEDERRLPGLRLGGRTGPSAERSGGPGQAPAPGEVLRPGHDLAGDPAAVARNAQGHPLAPELVVQVGDRGAAVGEAEHLEG